MTPVSGRLAKGPGIGDLEDLPAFSDPLHGGNMKLATQLGSLFPAVTKCKGDVYFRQNRVLLVDAIDGRTVEAQVRGSGGRDYDVTIDARDAKQGVLSAECTCPHFADGFVCKHLWATILEIDSDPDFDFLLGGDFAAKQSSAASHGGSSGTATATVTEVDRIFQRALGQSGPSAPPADGWKGRMSRVLSVNARHAKPPHDPPERSPNKIHFVLNVAECLAAKGLVIRPMSVSKRAKDGQLIASPYRMKQWEMAHLGHKPTSRALQLLLDNDVSEQNKAHRHTRYYSYGSAPDHVKLSTLCYPAVLPLLCETGRFVWRLHTDQPIADAVPIRWDDGAAYRLLLHGVDVPEESCWRIEPRLFRDGEDPIDFRKAAALCLPEVVLFEEGRMCRANLQDQWGWIDVALRSSEALTVPYDDQQEFVAYLYSMPRLPERDLPPELDLPVELGHPEPKLRLQAKEHDANTLLAHVSFRYGDVERGLLDPGECIVADEGVFRRDFQKEREWIEPLTDLGFRLGHVQYDDGAPFALGRYRFMDAVEKLMDRGWNVEAENGVIKRPGGYSFSVQTGVDWFDLESEFDFDGASARLPDLLAAARNGEKFVQLDDGTQGLLPKEWLEKFEKLAGLGEIQEEGQVRFQASQAMLLDALLSAQENVQLDRGFRQFREKLAKFNGIAPLQEPKTFKGELRPYQREGLGWLTFLQDFNFGGCLADDMGLGKTIQTLALLEKRRKRRLKQGERRHPSLIVVPKSLVFNWLDEASRFTPKLKGLNYTGLGRKEFLDRFDEYDFIVTTYGTLRRDIVALKDRQFDYVILDEAQAIKNAQSQSAKACRLLPAQHRLAMTGTPIENHLGELWSLFEFLNPGLLGHSQAFERFSRSDDEASRKLLQRAIAPYILRRTKQQVLTELPEKTEQTIFCDLSPKQRKEYDELRDYYRTLLTDKISQQGLNRSKIHVLEALLRLRQAACHPGLIDKTRFKDKSAKLEALLGQIEEVVDEGHKVLVFSQFTTMLDILRKHMEGSGIRYEHLTGRTRKRKECVERFQNDPDCRLFLISLKAGGHGLNLTAAEYVYILDPWWNPAVEAQAIDRAHRIGQENHVFAYRIIARDTVEEKVLELQKRKKDLADAIINANDSLVRSLTADDLQLLLS
jgi:superfamily II DNA or RNA helicase